MKMKLYFFILSFFCHTALLTAESEEENNQLDSNESIVPRESYINDYEARLALAKSLSYQENRRKDALVQYKILLKERPDDIELLLEISQIYTALKQYREALDSLKAALDKNPGNFKLILTAAQAETGLGHFVEAQILISRICFHLETAEEGTIFIAIADMKMIWGDYYGAESIYRNLIDIDGHPELLASVYVATGQYEKAVSRIMENPDKPEFLIPLANLKNAEKKFDEALDIIHQLIGMNPQKGEYRLLEANTLFSMRCFEEALASYQLLSADEKFYLQAAIGIGRCDLDLNLKEEAEYAFKALLAVDPLNAEARFYLAGDAVEDNDFIDKVKEDSTTTEELESWAKVYIENGLSEKAEQFYTASIKLDPKDTAAQLALAEMLSINYSFDSALEIYRPLLDDFPDNYKIMISIARVLGWAKRYCESIEWYDRVIALNPENPTPILEKARTFLWAKMFDKSMATYEYLIELLDEQGLENLKKSVCLEMKTKRLVWDKRFLHALPCFKEQVELNPGNEDALYEYGQDYCNIGRCDLARKIYNDILNIDPNHSLDKMTLERNLMKSNLGLESHFAYWREMGSGSFSQSQIARYSLDEVIEIPLTCRSHLRFIQHEWVENPFFNYKFYPAEGQSVEADYILNNYVRGDAAVSYKTYFDKFKSRISGYVHFSFNMFDYCSLNVGVDKENEIYNYFCMKEAIQSTAGWLSIKSDLTRYWNAEGSFRFKNYNDHNTQVIANLNTQYSFTEDPTIAKVILNCSYYNTAHITIPILDGLTPIYVIHPYWTPKHYFMGSIAFDWRHNYQKFEFCEAPQRYFGGRLTFGDDTTDNLFIQFILEWKHEFKEHWGFEIKGVIHRSKFWNAEGAWGSINYRF